MVAHPDSKGTWSSLFHWKSTLPVLMSISCTTPLMTVWSAGPPMEVRSAVAVVYERISVVFHGVMKELVAIGRQAVAGVDGRVLLVVVVVDVVGPGGETSEAGPLPPGKDRLPVVGLGPEIGCRLTRRDRVEPDDLTRPAEDLRPVGIGPRVSCRGDEDVAVADGSARGEEGYRWRCAGRGRPTGDEAREA